MVKSTPPGGDFGASKKTKALRPETAMTPDEISTARRMRREGASPKTIASDLGVSLEDTKLALAGLRTQNPNRNRETLNVGNSAYRAILKEKSGTGEPLWQTMDRLMTELHELRKRTT